MSDPYASWDTTQATDDSDGLPDTAMIPIVEALRRAGIDTLASCQGHMLPEYGSVHREGGLIVSVGPTGTYSSLPFTRIVYYTTHEEWEFWWHPDNYAAAVAEIAKGYGVTL